MPEAPVTPLSLKARLAGAAFHPWLFALFPLLSLYAVNHSLLTPADLVRPFLLVLAFMGLLWLTLAALLHWDKQRSALITSALLFWFFTYGHLSFLHYPVQDILAVFLPNAYTLTETACILPIWLIGLLATLVLAFRAKRHLALIGTALNLTGIVLIVLPLLSLSATQVHHISASRVTEESAEASPSPPRTPGNISVALSGEEPTATAPDVYFIILDAYGRSDVLQHFFHYDNAPFLNELMKRGFFVAKKSRANYDQTVLCLSAALGMRYPDDIAQRETTDGDDLTPLTHRIDQSPVSAFLKKRGYRYISITTGFSLTQADSADLLLGNSHPVAHPISAFESLILGVTPLGLLPRVSQSLFDEHRNYLNDAWQHLIDMPTHQPERKFVFTHIVAPHPPFVFGPNGEPRNPDRKEYSLADGSDFLRTSTRAVYRQGYIDQLQYVNKRTLEAIDSLQKNSKVKPIIILIGDHGPRQFLDYDSLERTDPRECFANLFSVSLPDGSASKLYGDDISAVNAFRLLFDHYFNADYPRLPDKSFYSTSVKPYDFTDITDRTALK